MGLACARPCQNGHGREPRGPTGIASSLLDKSGPVRNLLADMESVKGVLEIPRGAAAHVYKLAAGLALLGMAALVVTGRPEEWRVGLVLASPFAVFGLLLTANHVVALIRRRAPLLRATRAGLWFGAGAIVPWTDVAAICEAGIQIERYGFSVRTRAINIQFRRRRALLGVPSLLWFTTRSLDTVKISLFATTQPPHTVVAQLEMLRLAAIGHENGALPGASEVPVARIARAGRRADR